MNSANVSPVVRQFIPCLGVTCDTTVTPNRYTLDGPFFALYPPPGIGYPFVADMLWVFCQLSDATDTHTFHLDLSFDLDRRVRPLRSFRVYMGEDKLAVRHYAVPIERVPFRRPGVYELVLRYGAEVLARATIRLEEVS
jgi:hypothetical protein